MKKKKNKLDYAQEYEDKVYNDLEKELNKLYKSCEKDIENKMNNFFNSFEKKNEKWLKRLKSGELEDYEMERWEKWHAQGRVSDKDYKRIKNLYDNGKLGEDLYKRWLEGQVFQGKMWGERKEILANKIYQYNDKAYKIIRDKDIDIFTENYNYMAFVIEKDAGVFEIGFHVYDNKSIEKIIDKDADILPYKKLDKSKDIRWNFKNFKTEVAKAIIQGESVDKLAKRLAEVVTNRNENEMKKHARTSLNSARNQGRLLRMEDAEKMGIKIKKRWDATLDFRTRTAHAILDGQVVDMNDSFEVEGMEIRFPGDPHAHPSLVYNCRCRLDAEIEGYPPSINLRRDNESKEIIGNMNYKEWYEKKKGEPLPKYKKPRKKRKRK